MPLVPSEHHFDDPEYVRAWTDGINKRRSTRLLVFAQIADVLATWPARTSRVLELGSGPGMLAEQLLQHVDTIDEHTLFDFSEPMHELARERLAPFASRTVHVVGSFLDDDWINAVSPPYDAIVSLQAVHELRDATLIPGLYRDVHRLLAPGGALLIGDLINRDGDYQGHRLTPDEHLHALSSTGFDDTKVLSVYDDLALVRATARRSQARGSPASQRL
jgi:SAM-dependent methyltransferase